MILTYIGNKKDLKYKSSFLWEETGLYINIMCYSWGKNNQEYDITFPEKDWSRIKVQQKNNFKPIIKEHISMWIDKPNKNYLKIIEELKKQCISFLELELEINSFYHELIYMVFEDMRLKI